MTRAERKEQLKDRTITTIIFATMMLIIFICIGIVGHFETHYKREAIVTKVNNDSIIVMDSNNNYWEFKGKGYKVNDNVTLEMFTNDTSDNIYDDEIVNVKIKK